MRCCAGDGGLALRSRPAGGGSKPPRAAPVKSRGGERRGKVAPQSAAGVDHEGERKQTTDDVSKDSEWHQNRVELLRRVVEAYNTRDAESFVALCDPQVEVHSVFSASRRCRL